MTLYSFVLLIHIVGAVVGLGSTFGMPVLMGRVKNVSQAKFALLVSQGTEKLAKIGSIALLVTGIIMAIMNPDLFKQIWYIASIVIYIAVQPIAAGILPKKAKLQMEILEKHQGEDLPEEYNMVAKQAIPLNNILHVSAIVLIILMTIKPF
ncbi:hypothetical protein BABA_12805 [Neobacillus bataviensis LMG 21833]|uniref:Integral membrane protein n=1 Tax=Neobacillus bataviensis LMG 21833 TaxID=1117379 RepID=K6DH36_9BACI|nr:DUF2269 family protein [Neobacillus bataviensis]EKN67609.1 hypothetical protein BABA_12805 [Neobacillus bataviensis LMG 21833]